MHDYFAKKLALARKLDPGLAVVRKNGRYQVQTVLQLKDAETGQAAPVIVAENDPDSAIDEWWHRAVGVCELWQGLVLPDGSTYRFDSVKQDWQRKELVYYDFYAELEAKDREWDRELEEYNNRPEVQAEERAHEVRMAYEAGRKSALDEALAALDRKSASGSGRLNARAKGFIVGGLAAMLYEIRQGLKR